MGHRLPLFAFSPLFYKINIMAQSTVFITVSKSNKQPHSARRVSPYDPNQAENGSQSQGNPSDACHRENKSTLEGRHHQPRLERSTQEEYLNNVGSTLILELKTCKKIATQSDNSSQQFSRSQAVEQTDATSLAKPTNEDSLQNLLVRVLDPLFLPIADLLIYVFLYSCERFIDILKIVMLAIMKIHIRVQDIKPTVVSSFFEYRHLSTWGLQKSDLSTFMERRFVLLEVVQEPCSAVTQTMQPDQ